MEGQFIGAVFGARGVVRRTRHSLCVVVGVLQAWIGRGVGRALLQALEEWALSRGLHRLELAVAVDNARAIALYERFGFEREGVKRHSRKIEGRYSDELYIQAPPALMRSIFACGLLSFVVLCASAAVSTHGAVMHGRVSQIVDGDTLDVIIEGKRIRVRLLDIRRARAETAIRPSLASIPHRALRRSGRADGRK
jgi:Acetyltransferase (GNAT) family